MQRVYQGRYYSGTSSKAVTANVRYEADALVISYSDESGEPRETRWPKQQIKEIQYASGIISLRFGDAFPFEQLDVTDQGFIREYGLHFRVSTYKKLAHGNRRAAILYILVGFVGLVVLSWFFVLPFCADLFARSFPQKYEVALGRQLYESILQDEEIDVERSKQINRFFRQLKVEGDYPVDITVVDKDIMNAFALPGGGIVVYSKILDEMSSYDELAALLAHEYSHVQLRHATRNIFRNLAGYLFVSMVFGDISGVTAVLMQHAESLRTLKYSRSLETEADDNAFVILKENRISVEGVERLFTSLKEENSLTPPEILSSHPDIDERIESSKQFRKANPYEEAVNDSLDYFFKKLN